MNERTSILALFLLILCTFPLSSDSMDEKNEDPNLWEVSFALELPTASFSIYEEPDAPGHLDYDPNNALVGRIGLRYKNLGLSIALGQNVSDTDYDLTTNYYDFQGSLYLDKWGGDLYLQRYQGYVLEEHNGTISLLPKLQCSTYTLNVYRKIIGNTGLYSFTDFREGGPILSYFLFGLGSLSYRSIDADKGFIPAAYQSTYESFYDLTSLSLITPTLSIGLFCGLDIRILHLFASLSAGYGYPFVSSDSNPDSELSLKVNMKGGGEIHLGDLAIGMMVIGDSDGLSLSNDQSIQFYSILVSSYISYKF